MTFLEAKQALARKLDIDYSDIANNALFSDTDLGDFVQTGVNRAWDYKPWTFSEDTFKATSISDDYYDYPTNFEDESISLLSVGGNEFSKKLFADYLKYFELHPTATDKFWSEHKRWYFINKNAYTVGDEIDVTGKLRAPTLSASGDLLPFSFTSDNYEDSGNRAIVQLAYAEALSSQKKNNVTQAQIEEEKAFAILDGVWEPMSKRRALEQSKDRPFFDVPDYFQRGIPGGRSQNYGNFP